MLAFVIQHQFWLAVALYWIFSAAVSSMPEPPADGAPIYVWLFRFLHTLAGNITTAFGNKIPGAKALLVLIAVPLLISGSACAAVHYTVHPGALDQLDSSAYDTLVVAQATIEAARADYDAGRLAEETKAAFDTLVRSYNDARNSWLTYRDATTTQVPATAFLSQLNQNLTDLANALRAFSKPSQNGKDAR
jgi:hypothetical protein